MSSVHWSGLREEMWITAMCSITSSSVHHVGCTTWSAGSTEQMVFRQAFVSHFEARQVQPIADRYCIATSYTIPHARSRQQCCLWQDCQGLTDNSINESCAHMACVSIVFRRQSYAQR